MCQGMGSVMIKVRCRVQFILKLWFGLQLGFRFSVRVGIRFRVKVSIRFRVRVTVLCECGRRFRHRIRIWAKGCIGFRAKAMVTVS